VDGDADLRRAGGRPPVRPDRKPAPDGGGLALQAIVPAFVMAGTGMALVFAPSANAVLSSVRPEEAGQTSGATYTIREVGGVLGVGVLATVFTSSGGFESPAAYVDGLIPAVWVGSAVLAAGRS
jgi:hypothetical protein